MICIDSDDEAFAGQAGQEWPDAPAQELNCSLLLPQGRTPSSASGSVPKLGAMEGSFFISSASGWLELRRSGGGGRDAAAAYVATTSVSGIEVLPDNRTVLLRFGHAVQLGHLWAAAIAMLGLLPATGVGVGAVLATLRFWLPHVAVTPNKLALARPVVNTPGFMTLRWDGIELTSRDIDLLGEERCLNDSVMDFFLKLVVEVLAPPELREQMHVTSTFFFQKLTSCGVESGEEGWQNVRKWHGNLKDGLLSQDYIIVPINEQNIHWWLLVVCFPRRALEQTPLDGLPSGCHPRIVCLDSGQEPPPKARATSFLRGYLWREWRERHPEAAAAAGSIHKLAAEKLPRSWQMRAIDADVPKQQNGYDCGLFVIEYLMTFFRSRSALKGLGWAPHQHWFGQGVVSHRRRRLRKIAEGLRNIAVQRSEPDVARLLQDTALRSKVREMLGDLPKEKRHKAPDAEESRLYSDGRPPKRAAPLAAIERARSQLQQ